MDIKDIRQIMKEFADSSLLKMNLEFDGVTLQMEKEPSFSACAEYAAAASPAKAVVSKTAAERLVAENTADDADKVAVKSPVVGVFYSASAPGAAPLVTVGQRVEKGQVLCIIEAMKMMNEITAPVSGTLTDVLVEKEAAVEYDQPLMFIKV